jgi:hypothetical protein
MATLRGSSSPVTAPAGEADRTDRLHGHARQLRGAQALADDFSSLDGRWP